MSDREIPIKCRTCEYCERYYPLGGTLYSTLYSWLPWKYKCKLKDCKK